MCARKKGPSEAQDPIQEVLNNNLPKRNRRKEELFAAVHAAEPPSPEDVCSANECLCELIRTTLNDLSPTQKSVFSYWLLKLRSDRRPLDKKELRTLSAYLYSLIGIIGTDNFDSILSGVLALIESAAVGSIKN